MGPKTFVKSYYYLVNVGVQNVDFTFQGRHFVTYKNVLIYSRKTWKLKKRAKKLNMNYSVIFMQSDQDFTQFLIKDFI